MMEVISKILLLVSGPLLKYLASKAPDKVISILMEVAPVMDALKAAVADEKAARDAKVS